MKSLLLIGFPRGFTSQAYTIAKHMLPQLKESQVSAGEVLNQLRNDAIDRDINFYIRAEDPLFEEAYQYYCQLLNQYTDGYIIKDVVQPYIVLRYLQENPNKFNTLFINRPLEHVRFALERKGWAFSGDPEQLHATLQQFPSLDVNQAYYKPDYVFNLIQSFYSEAIPYDYLSPEFIRLREKFLSDFSKNLWKNCFRSIKNTQIFETHGLASITNNEAARWTLAKTATIKITLPNDTPTAKNLSIKTTLPRCFEGHSVNVDFSINSTKISCQYSKSTSDILVSIPLSPNDFEQQTILLTINNELLISPKQLGLSNDVRHLGIGIIAIGLFDDKDLINEIKEEIKPNITSRISSYWHRLIATKPTATQKTAATTNAPIQTKIIDENSDEQDRFIKYCYQHFLQRNADAAGIKHYKQLLNNHSITHTDIIEKLLSSNEYQQLKNTQNIYHQQQETEEDTGNKSIASKALQSCDNIEREVYEKLWQNIFSSDRDLVIGQQEYGRQHKQRFWELCNAIVYLSSNRHRTEVTDGRHFTILEFGVSEFSAMYKKLLPNIQLHCADRPSDDDYIGFNKNTSLRVSGSKEFIAVDLNIPKVLLQSQYSPYHNQYDLVIFTEVLEHLTANPVDILEQLLALLKPSGSIYLTTPNFFRQENIRKIKNRDNPQEVYPAGENNWDAHHHYREYALKELLQFIEQAGGVTEAFYFSDCWDIDPTENDSEKGNMVFVIQAK